MEVAILVGVAAGLVMVYSLIARYFPVYEETVAYKAVAEKNKPSPEMPRLEETPRNRRLTVIPVRH